MQTEVLKREEFVNCDKKLPVILGEDEFSDLNSVFIRNAGDSVATYDTTEIEELVEMAGYEVRADGKAYNAEKMFVSLNFALSVISGKIKVKDGS